MKTKIFHIIITICFVLSGTAAIASESGKAVDHSLHKGMKIHEADEQGYHLSYHLIDLPDNSFQHLVVYIADKKGEAIADGKVGFLIKGPDGSEQKVMAMVMKDSFGGNIDFQTKGTYTIKTKVLFKKGRVFNEFSYEVE